MATEPVSHGAHVTFARALLHFGGWVQGDSAQGRMVP